MKNPFRSPPSSDAVYNAVERRLVAMLVDRESELRQLFARLARSEAKNFFALHLGTEVEKFDQELAQRAARTLGELGSVGHAPSGQLDREVRRALAILERDHRKVLYVLPEDKVCWNSACVTREPLPHMLDERDHRSIGDVIKATGIDKLCDLQPKLECEYRLGPCPIPGCPIPSKENL